MQRSACAEYLLSFVQVCNALRVQGTSGECGLRGGYVEMTNIHPGTIEEVYKCASINLCPNTMGQVGARLGCSVGIIYRAGGRAVLEQVHACKPCPAV